MQAELKALNGELAYLKAHTDTTGVSDWTNLTEEQFQAAAAWLRALDAYAASLVDCPANPLHVWAKLNGKQGDAMRAAWEEMQGAANAEPKSNAACSCRNFL